MAWIGGLGFPLIGGLDRFGLEALNEKPLSRVEGSRGFSKRLRESKDISTSYGESLGGHRSAEVDDMSHSISTTAAPKWLWLNKGGTEMAPW